MDRHAITVELTCGVIY